jgi:hypothetical protein
VERAIIIMDRAMMAPTERSMPAVRMTTNSPRANMAFTEDWRATLLRFSLVRKYSGDRMASAIIKRIRARAMPKRSSTAGSVRPRDRLLVEGGADMDINLPP